MKLIIINDNDGHTTVYKYDMNNLYKILKYIDEIGGLDGELKEEDQYNSYEDFDELLGGCSFINQRGGQCIITDLVYDIPDKNVFD